MMCLPAGMVLTVAFCLGSAEAFVTGPALSLKGPHALSGMKPVTRSNPAAVRMEADADAFDAKKFAVSLVLGSALLFSSGMPIPAFAQQGGSFKVLKGAASTQVSYLQEDRAVISMLAGFRIKTHDHQRCLARREQL